MKMKDVDLILPEKGPQCLAGRIFMQLDPEELVRQLLASGLDWHWNSERAEPPLSDQPMLPATRVLTHLTTLNAMDLIYDLEELDENHEHRWLNLFGFGKEIVSCTWQTIQSNLQNFLADKQTTLDVVIFREGDSARDHICFPRQIGIAVTRLLGVWNLNLNNARTRRRRTLSWLDRILTGAYFPVFLRHKGDKRVLKYDTIDKLRKALKASTIEVEQYAGWDSRGFPIFLSLPSAGSPKSLDVERASGEPQIEEATRAFADFAASEQAPCEFPKQFNDLRELYDAMQNCIQRRTEII
jgi:hypothetical protein